MLLGPTFSAELITSARRARYFVLRVAYAAIVLLLLWTIYISVATVSGGGGTIREQARLASAFFHSFIWLQMLAVLALGPAMAGSLIARERERRTLEYLLASPLTNSEIVLGKLTAGLLKLTYAVLVGLPILALSMLMGGIGPGELLAAFVFTLSTMLVVSGLSIAISALSARARDAVVRSYLVLVVFMSLPVIVANLPYLARIPGVVSAMQPLLEANPIWALGRIESGAGEFGSRAGWSFVLHLVRNQGIFAVLCIAAAVWSVRRAYLKSAGAAKRPRKDHFRIRISFRLRRNPMMWKELQVEQSRGKRSVVGIVALALLLLAVLNAAAWRFVIFIGSSSPGAAKLFVEEASSWATFLSCIGFLIIAVKAANSVSSERERETWTSLLTTPLAARQIVTAKLLGSIYSARWVGLAILPLWAVSVFVSPGSAVSLPPVLMTLLLMSTFAAGMGLLFSLWCKSSTRATIWTIGVSMCLAGGYLPIVGFLVLPLVMLGPVGNETWGQVLMVTFFAPLIPFLVGLSYELRNLDFSPSSGEWILMSDEHQLATYLVGNLGYFALTLGILWICYRHFERFTGRTDYARRRPLSIYRVVRKLALLLTVLVVVVVICLTIFRRPVAIAYHKWRMNAEFNTIFGNPEPAGNGLASFDMTGIDVDAVLEKYKEHQQALVELDVLCHVTASLPLLKSDSSEQQSSARTAFVHRMWDIFPAHQHYYLASDGQFKAWAPIDQEPDWKRFLDGESEPLSSTSGLPSRAADE